ncbi:MAG: hypothetical protein AAFY99_07675 [Pseudomonadota bacterium]
MPTAAKTAFTQRQLIERAANYQAASQVAADPIERVSAAEADYINDMVQISEAQARDYSLETMANSATDAQLGMLGASNRRRQVISATSDLLDEFGLSTVDDRREILEMAESHGSADPNAETSDLLTTNAAFTEIITAMERPGEALPDRTIGGSADELAAKVNELKEAISAEVQAKATDLGDFGPLVRAEEWDGSAHSYVRSAKVIEETFQNYTDDPVLQRLLAPPANDASREAPPAQNVVPEAQVGRGADEGNDNQPPPANNFDPNLQEREQGGHGL